MSLTNVFQSKVLPDGQCCHGECSSRPARQFAFTASSISDDCAAFLGRSTHPYFAGRPRSPSHSSAFA